MVISLFATKPNGGRSSSSATVDITISDVATAFTGTVNDLRAFCGRNMTICKTGKSFLNSIGEHARDGAKIAYEYLDRTFSGKDTTQSKNTGPK